MLRRTRLLIVGDSVSAGFGVAPGRAYSYLVAERFADRGLPYDVVVEALDGADTGYVLRRFDRMITRHDPDCVVVALGLNDARPPQGRPGRTPLEFAGGLLAILDRVLTLGADAVLMTPTPRFDTPEERAAVALANDACFGLMAPYAAATVEVAAALRLPLIDVFHALRGETRLAALFPDGVHPNPTGHELLADVVTEELLAAVSGDTPTGGRRMAKQAMNDER